MGLGYTDAHRWLKPRDRRRDGWARLVDHKHNCWGLAKHPRPDFRRDDSTCLHTDSRGSKVKRKDTKSH